MGDNKVDASFNSKIVTDLKAFQNENPEAKNMKQLNTIFSAMDKNNSGTIDEDEGTLFYYSDGTISATKCEKSVGNDGKITEHYKMFMGANDNGVYEYDSEGNVIRASFTDGTVETYGKEYTKSVRQQDDNTFEFGYNKDKELVYKKLTDKNGKEFLLSPTNKKVASIEEDGSIRTDFKTRDSFEGTMLDLGLDPLDTFLRTEFEKANPDAKRAERFMPDVNDPSAMQVKIPKSILDKYEVVFYNNEIKLKPKAEGAPAGQPWEDEAPNPERAALLRDYADQLRTKGEVIVQGQIGTEEPNNSGIVIQPVQVKAQPVQIESEAPVQAEVIVEAEVVAPKTEVSVQPEVTVKEEVDVSGYPKFKEAVNNIPNPRELANDKIFQGYRDSLIKSYEKMAQCALKGGWEMGIDPSTIDNETKKSIVPTTGMDPNNISSFIDDSFDFDTLEQKRNTAEFTLYALLYSNCSVELSQLNNYVEVMNNWEDGTVKEGFRTIGGIEFRDPKMISLKDGQKAWECDEGVFYPYRDGLVGGPRVPEKLIPQ